MPHEINADPTELAKFSERAHHWWNLDSEFRPLHDINPLRMEWIERIAPLREQYVLDVGCGGGILSEGIARKGADVLGIDLSAQALLAAQQHAADEGIDAVAYREISAEDLADAMPGEFDIVTCMEMLEHVPDPASVVQACAQLVRPGGWVFFSSIHRSAKAFALAIVAAEYLLNMVPRGTHEYAKLIRPSELASYCRAAGLDLCHAGGLAYNPVTRRYRLTSDTSVNYMLAARRPG